MQQQLIDHSQDLKRLVDAGFNLEIDGGHVLVHHIPYLNSAKQVKLGTLICPLNLSTPTKTARPNCHTMHFCGETPCNPDGTPMTALIIQSNIIHVTERVTVNHLFSSKPACGYYEDYYEKFWTYSQALLTAALTVDPTVTSRQKNKLK